MDSGGRFGDDERIPEAVRDIFAELCEDVVMLHHQWDFYSEVYGKPENAALLANLARASFYLIEATLRDDITMNICRLGDKDQTFGHDNLTLEMLVSRCPEVPGMESLWERFRAACEPFKRHRDKRIGHSDLGTSVRPHENPLPWIGRPQVEEVLGLAAGMLQAVYAHYANADVIPTPFHIGGAKDLMFWLRRGWEDHRRELKGLGIEPADS